MALVVSRVGNEKGGPFPTNLHGLWWARAKLSFTGGQNYIAGGLPIGATFRTSHGFSRIAFISFDHGGGDVTAACATGVICECIPSFFRVNQRIAMYGIGRAVNGGAGVPVGAGTELTNGTSVDAITFLMQVWGFM